MVDSILESKDSEYDLTRLVVKLFRSSQTHNGDIKSLCEDIIIPMRLALTTAAPSLFPTSTQADSSASLEFLLENVVCSGITPDALSKVHTYIQSRTHGCIHCPEVNSSMLHKNISLQLPINTGKTVAVAMDRYFGAETLTKENFYDCYNCQQRTCSKRHHELVGTLPEAFLINHTLKSLQHSIDLGPNSTFFEFGHHYDLHSLVLHLGTDSAGHYLALLRKWNSTHRSWEWWICNDEIVRPINKGDWKRARTHVAFMWFVQRNPSTLTAGTPPLRPSPSPLPGEILISLSS